MNQDQMIQDYSKAIVTGLVGENVIGHSTGTQWVLAKPLFGYNGETTFPSAQDAIKALVPVFATYLQKNAANLRVAS